METHRHRQTQYYYNPPPMVGLITHKNLYYIHVVLHVYAALSLALNSSVFVCVSHVITLFWEIFATFACTLNFVCMCGYEN